MHGHPFRLKLINVVEWSSQSTSLEPFENWWEDLQFSVDICCTQPQLICKEEIRYGKLAEMHPRGLAAVIS